MSFYFIVILQYYKEINMGATKTDLFTEKQNQIAVIAKALGHPARVAIIEYLISVDQCICRDLTDEIPLAQPTISQHLKELKNAGLIKGSVEGTSVCYCINGEAFSLLTDYFATVIVPNKKCC